jgi:hypothetical protein
LLIVVVVVVVLGHGSMLAKAFPRGEEAGTEEPPSAVLVPKISRTTDDHDDEDDLGCGSFLIFGFRVQRKIETSRVFLDLKATIGPQPDELQLSC